MERPLGYIILENETKDVPISNVEVIDKPHLFYVRFDATLQSLDCINRNRRKYRGDAVVEGLSTPEISELIANKKWKGECDHPITKEIQRIATVLSKYESHYITKWWRDGNLIKGTIESIDDGKYGTALAKRTLQGENPSFSLRALAILEKANGITVVNRAPRVITYDEVNLPSHKEAYAERKKQKIISDGSTERVYEGLNVTDIEKNGATIAIEAGDIKDMITSNCENLKMVCESFDIDPSSLMITNGGNALSVKQGGDTFVVAIGENARLCNEINDYYRYMTGLR